MRLLMVTREKEVDRLYGLGKSLVPLIEGLKAKGHHVDYLSAEQVGKKSISFITQINKFVHYLFPNSTHLVGALLERFNMGRLASKLAAEDNYTHVHMHDPWIAFSFFIVQTLLYRRTPKKWGFTEHGFGCYGQATLEDGLLQTHFQIKQLRSLERWVSLRAHWVISPTQAVLTQLTKDLSLPYTPPNWFVLPHPLPSLSTTPKDIARDKLGWDKTTHYIIGVGRLAPLKRFDMMLRACAELSSHIPFHIIILGGGDDSSLLTLAVELGIEDKLTLTITNDVGLYLSAADVYVSSSSSESFGYANFEALQIKTPCICTAVGGVAEVMGLGAWLIPYNQQALTQSLNILLLSTDLQSDLKKRASKRAKEWPTLSEITDKYEQFVA